MGDNEQRKLDFIEIILDLKETYNNLDFELLDSDNNFTRKLEIWYGVLGHIDLKVLRYVVFDFIKTSVYPPNSPASIKQHYEKLYLELQEKGDIAFDYCIDLWRKNRHDFVKTAEQLEQEHKKAHAKAFRLIRGQLYQAGGLTANTSDIMLWGRKEFKEKYNEYVVIYARETINNNGKAMLIENNRPKLNTRALLE